jgi:hypothetical protein
MVVSEDAIPGVRLQLTFSTDRPEATMVTAGNVNAGGRTDSLPLRRVQASGYFSFVGIDPSDGSSYLLSYFPQTRRAIWSMHNDRLVMITGVALAKSFLMECNARST